MTIDLETVDSYNRCKVDRMQAVGSSLDPAHPDSCGIFVEHVRQVEAALIHTYGFVAHLAVRKSDPAEAADLWRRMTLFCDFALDVLKGFKISFPHCGTSELYDLALDYRNAADEKRQQNLRDSECLKLTIPGLLFQKTS